MIDLELMSQRYQKSRQAFLSAASHAGAKLEHIKHPSSGPTGEDLFLDIALLGNPQAQKLMMLASGTHGIEGYLGSQLQSDMLERGVFNNHLDDNCIVFIHAINPYGMAWHRRVNENNVDLNRNFIDFDKALPENEAYVPFNELVNPQQWNDEIIENMEKKIAAFIKQVGFMAYLKALSGGQYHFPQGIQFGGQEPQWSNRQLHDLWQRFVPGRKLVFNIDIHSGLGVWGEGLIMLSGNDDEAAIQRVRKLWDGLLISPRPKPDETIMSGILGTAMEESFPEQELIPVCLEFGTLDTNQVGKALVADNWLHHHGDLESEQGQQIKQDILDAFYVEDEGFYNKVYARTEKVVCAALSEVCK